MSTLLGPGRNTLQKNDPREFHVARPVDRHDGGRPMSLPHPGAGMDALCSKAAALTLVAVFAAFPVSVALANSLMALTLVLLLPRVFRHGTRCVDASILKNPVAWPVFCLAAYILLAATWSPAEWIDIGGYFKKYLKFLLLPIFITLLFEKKTRVLCWKAFALAMLFTLVSTWLNVWTSIPWSRTDNQGFGVDHTVFKDYISQGIMMAFFVCLCAFWAIRAHSRKAAVGWWLVAALGAASILFLSAGRTGYLSLLFSTLVFGIFFVGARIKKVLGILVGALAVLTVAFLVSPQFQHRSMQAWEEARSSSLSTVTSVGARVEVWRFVVKNSSERSLLGAGTASYPVLAQSYFKDPQFCATVCPHPHNQFLLFFFELGLVGLLLFFWLLFVIVRQAFRYPRAHRALMLSFVAVLVTSNMTHSSFWLSTESHFFIMMMALLMASAGSNRAVPPPGAAADAPAPQP